MAVCNVHERRIDAPADEVGKLIDQLASPDDRLWPRRDWPPMELDGPLRVGASGGHGPVRYAVIGYTPGRWVRFRFSGPRGFHGFHAYTVRSDGAGGAVLQHLLTMRTRGAARLTWPLAFRWLHDAVLEDSLDLAEAALSSGPSSPARWNAYVRLLRRGMP
ncbi:SRPBCC family protein [Streptomyces zagrosensis]|uniref:SRPBCC family protein n=1 Tax=Streptomyces zagrosensis TaxID=1042984 RepID=A0A7W9V168_9ACTN|nr:SRPBCC family protein [Streptomyces zagrosensis]MBB5937469.1 hypothetical protein [Streptomyces zagrosensis]